MATDCVSHRILWHTTRRRSSLCLGWLFHVSPQSLIRLTWVFAEKAQQGSSRTRRYSHEGRPVCYFQIFPLPNRAFSSRHPRAAHSRASVDAAWRHCGAGPRAGPPLHPPTLACITAIFGERVWSFNRPWCPLAWPRGRVPGVAPAPQRIANGLRIPWPGVAAA